MNVSVYHPSFSYRNLISESQIYLILQIPRMELQLSLRYMKQISDSKVSGAIFLARTEL